MRGKRIVPHFGPRGGFRRIHGGILGGRPLRAHVVIRKLYGVNDGLLRCGVFLRPSGHGGCPRKLWRFSDATPWAVGFQSKCGIPYT